MPLSTHEGILRRGRTSQGDSQINLFTENTDRFKEKSQLLCAQYKECYFNALLQKGQGFQGDALTKNYLDAFDSMFYIRVCFDTMTLECNWFKLCHFCNCYPEDLIIRRRRRPKRENGVAKDKTKDTNSFIPM